MKPFLVKRGLLLLMHILTSGKVTLGQVIVKGTGVMENGR